MENQKKLKICLAMGGGVSLGSFSGSALTEALKLLILYGKDKDEDNAQPYKEVIIDGMSGASAGAVALVILLRCLIDYKSMIKLTGKTESNIVEELTKYYPTTDNNDWKNDHRFEQLKALQVAQDIQEKIWVESVDATKLFGKKPNKKFKHNAHDSFSLLDRKILEDLTKTYLMNIEDMKLDNIQVLNPERVLFACSLTNLLPIELKLPENETTQLQKNITRSIGSENHSEVRVIDFVFKDEKVEPLSKKTDPRWLKFSKEKNPIENTHFDLREKEAWATIASSALACAAFPFAFEPVFLKRFKEEYDINEKDSRWPNSFLEIIERLKNQKEESKDKFLHNSIFNDDNEKLDYDCFNFPYIDGGTFNNEPIKEAFKIGSFQDFENYNKKEEERLVLFVDPIVRLNQHHSFRLSSYSAISTDEKYKTKIKAEDAKLIGNATHLIGVLVEQGSIKEDHKINDVKENFELKNTLFEHIFDQGQVRVEELSSDLLKFTFKKITKNLNNSMISLGTREPHVFLKEYLKQQCLKLREFNENVSCLDLDEQKLKELKTKILGLPEDGKMKNSEIFTILGIEDPKEKRTFVNGIFKLISEFALDTNGKNIDAVKAAILPINEDDDIINLPGGELAAFGGFASKPTRKYAFLFGKYSALLSLSHLNSGFRKTPLIQFDENRRSGLIAAWRSELINLKIFSEEHKYAELLNERIYIPAIKRVKNILSISKFIKWLGTDVPFFVTSFFGPIYSFISFGRSLFGKQAWDGSQIIDSATEKFSKSVNYKSLQRLTISILSNKKLDRKVLIELEGQDKNIKLKAEELKVEGSSRYQYLFEVSLLEYKFPKDIEPLRSYSSFIDDEIETDLSMDEIKKVRLSMATKISIPKNEDHLLDPEDFRLTFEENYFKIITQFRLDKYNFGMIDKQLNNKDSALYFSIRNLSYHVNPVLEMDIEGGYNKWYFKENTNTLYKKLIRDIA